MGISFFHAIHRFAPRVKADFVPLANVSVELSEPALQIQSVRGGRIYYLEGNDLIENMPGKEVFRYVEKFNITPYLDTSKDSEFFSLTVSQSALESMLGKPAFKKLVESLGLSCPPSVTTQTIPPTLVQLLQNCMNAPALRSELQLLHAQSKALDFLCGLIDFVLEDNPDIASADHILSEAEVRKICKYLSELDGKLPRLEEISEIFGHPARILNHSFKVYFKESLYTAITHQRMAKAHSAILETGTPLKVLATNLGYSHVNHFSHAFKQRYGYSPGSLRKKSVQA